MYTLTAIWSAPDESDREEFEKHYKEVHAPLAADVPNIKELVTIRADEGLEGADPDFHRIAEMVFESPEALHEAEESDEWSDLREDAGEIVERFGVTLEVGIGEQQPFGEKN